jgi:dephospho-CoA kinase
MKRGIDMLKIGITGGIASGKSLATSYLIEQGYVVIDCDRITHRLLKDPSLIQAIQSTFGDSVVDENNQINRKQLGRIIFHDQEAADQLNRLVHPLVIDKIKERFKKLKKEKIVFVDVPLLYEANMEGMFDAVILVYVPFNVQLARLMRRDKIDRNYALAKIDRQMAMEEKLQLADYVIDNENSTEESILQLQDIIRRLLS